ncbi:MAG TPA: E3 binding domain-containing protein, partial [Flavobacteriales bacterium]|nr:E3 binding domain-containing protein [Flavobacteriales bacterium]
MRIARWLVKEGDVVSKDQVLGEIDSDKATLELSAEAEGKVQLLAKEDQTVNVGDVVVKVDTSFKAEKKTKAQEQGQEAKKAAPSVTPAPAPVAAPAHATPVAKAMLDEKGVSADRVKGSGPNGRVTKSDVAAYMAGGVKSDAVALNGWGGSRNQNRQKMTTLRKKVAERLVSVKNQTAMLTTF